MSRFKAVAVMVAVIAFLGYCVWLSPNLFGNRIRNEMVADSLLKYDRGADVYIASKDDNSKVYFDQSGKYKFFGTGALALKASPVGGEKSIANGFNLLIEGGELEIKSGQADILTGSVSPNGQYLALLKVDGRLSIYEISTGKTKYETDKTYFVQNPLRSGIVSYPFFFWSSNGIITFKTNYLDLYTNKTSENPSDWITARREILTGKNDQNSESIIESIEPSTGNINQIDFYQSNMVLTHIVGSIDDDSVLILATTLDVQPLQFLSFNLQTSSVTKIIEYLPGVIGYHDNALYFIKDNTLVYSNISAKSASTPVAIDLPTLDGEKLTPDLIENLRVTSKGYLHFRHIKTAKTYLLEPVSGVYVEIPIERYPY
jgi:hypothetical protein